MGKSSRSVKGVGRSRGDAAADAAEPESDPVSFEHALERLEGTVARLEEGEMPLEEALELFESGVNLSRDCSARLEEAERRIEILVADREGSNGMAAVDFQSDEDRDDDLEGASDDGVLEE